MQMRVPRRHHRNDVSPYGSGRSEKTLGSQQDGRALLQLVPAGDRLTVFEEQ